MAAVQPSSIRPRRYAAALIATALCGVLVTVGAVRPAPIGPPLLTFNPGAVATRHAVPLLWSARDTAGTFSVTDIRGTLVSQVHQPAGTSIVARSPDGLQAIFSDGAVVAWDGHVLGHFVPTPPSHGTTEFSVRAVWSDDDTHLCAVLDAAGGPIRVEFGMVNATVQSDEYLWVMAPNSPARRIAQIGSARTLGGGVITCAWARRIAVLSPIIPAGKGYSDGTASYVNLDTGAVTTIPQPAGRYTFDVQASHDGSLLAMVVLPYAPSRAVAPETWVMRVSSGEVVATFADSQPILFSWSTNLIVIQRPAADVPQPDPPPPSSGLPVGVQAMNWRTGAVVVADGVPTTSVSLAGGAITENGTGVCVVAREIGDSYTACAPAG